MANEYAAPINHTAGSAAASIAGGAGSGIVKSGVKTALKWIAGCAAVVGVAVGALAFAPLGLGAAIGLGLVGVAGGAVLGIWSSPWAGAVGGLVGGFKGGERAAQRVSEERGAAQMLQAQVDVAKAQTMTQAQEYNPYAAQNSAMNAANTRINVGADMAYDGRIAGQQLAAAR